VKARKVVKPNFVGLPHETLAEAGMKMTKAKLGMAKNGLKKQ